MHNRADRDERLDAAPRDEADAERRRDRFAFEWLSKRMAERGFEWTASNDEDAQAAAELAEQYTVVEHTTEQRTGANMAGALREAEAYVERKLAAHVRRPVPCGRRPLVELRRPRERRPGTRRTARRSRSSSARGSPDDGGDGEPADVAPRLGWRRHIAGRRRP